MLKLNPVKGNVMRQDYLPPGNEDVVSGKESILKSNLDFLASSQSSFFAQSSVSRNPADLSDSALTSASICNENQLTLDIFKIIPDPR